MEKQLPGFKMTHLVDRAEEFRAWLPVLSEMLEQNSILIVLDNLENLLTSDGGWKDERWGWLVEALLNHDGLSRVILTSRKLPKELVGNGRLIIEPINALSLNEATLLAREMPNLGRLLLGKSPVGLEKGRELVRRTLSLVQGHPKLIELADAQAADPVALEKYLAERNGCLERGEEPSGQVLSGGRVCPDSRGVPEGPEPAGPRTSPGACPRLPGRCSNSSAPWRMPTGWTGL